jgi:hypothetical protein
VLRVALVLCAAVALLAPAGAGAAESLAVRDAVLDVDRRILSLRVTCRASRSACAGVLRVPADGVAEVTHGLRVRLRPGRERTVRLRLRRDGVERFGNDNGEQLADVLLRSGGRTLEASVVVDVRVTCRSGTTTAETAGVRVLLVAGIASYACDRATGRLTYLAEDSHGLSVHEVVDVRIAGRFVAIHERGAWKCTGSTVGLFDVRARRSVRSRWLLARTWSDANGCTGTAPVVALVLRPSGALAWTEAPGDDGIAYVRAVDDEGDRILDAAFAVDPASLAADGPTLVRWTRAGETRTAPLS